MESGETMKPSGIGGQAVMEGVMMKNKNEYAVAVRKPDQEIVIEKNSYVSVTEKHDFFRLPIIRGVFAFVDSMIIGTKTLTYSASFFEEEEEQTKKKSKKEKSEKSDTLFMTLTVCLSLIMAVAIFILLPMFISSILTKEISNRVVIAIVEAVIRLSIFIGYIFVISKMKDIQRVFMYHGAEHKSINCIENGLELTVENVRAQSKEHKRCGTSFMLIVVVISSIFFMFIRIDNILLKTIVRLALVPVIAGISYEFIRLAGKSESKVVAILSKPGLWMQGLTTKEPTDDMIEVAIQSVEAVFDWKSFLEESKSEVSVSEVLE